MLTFKQSLIEKQKLSGEKLEAYINPSPPNNTTQRKNVLKKRKQPETSKHGDLKHFVFDDAKSNYSGISRVSKFTNNMMNKSTNGVLD